MEYGEKGMSSMQNVFSTYCEAVCILSESERQILERKGKERKEEAFHLSESVDRLFPLILIHRILAGGHVTFNWKENKGDQILNYGQAWWFRIDKSTSTLGTCIWDAQAK